MSEKEKEVAAYTAEQINKLSANQKQRIGDIAHGLVLANELAEKAAAKKDAEAEE